MLLPDNCFGGYFSDVNLQREFMAGQFKKYSLQVGLSYKHMSKEPLEIVIVILKSELVDCDRNDLKKCF